jgi:hypothetical protein
MVKKAFFLLSVLFCQHTGKVFFKDFMKTDTTPVLLCRKRQKRYCAAFFTYAIEDYYAKYFLLSFYSCFGLCYQCEPIVGGRYDERATGYRGREKCAG